MTPLQSFSPLRQKKIDSKVNIPFVHTKNFHAGILPFGILIFIKKKIQNINASTYKYFEPYGP